MNEEEPKMCPECGVVFTTKFNWHPNFQDHDCTEYKRWMKRLDDVTIGARKPLGVVVYTQNDIRIIEALSQHSIKLMIYMNYMAKFMEEPFRYPWAEKFKIFLILKGNACVGYCAWNYFKQRVLSLKQYERLLNLPSAPNAAPEKELESRLMVLRQIFIRHKFQRQGYAKTLVEQCLKHLGIQDKWVVEDANHRFRKWLIKHGHAHVEDNMIIGDKVAFTGVLR